MAINYIEIASSSKGNCNIINGMMIDCGVSYKTIKPYLEKYDVSKLWITHAHGDHLKVSTCKKIITEYPSVQVIGNQEVVDKLAGEIDVQLINPNENIVFSNNGIKTSIKPVELYHDVQNYGIFGLSEDELLGTSYSWFYATDTGTLEGINIPVCEHLFVECNYDDITLDNSIYIAQRDDKYYGHLLRVKEDHLSLEQWLNFNNEFLAENGTTWPLHQSGNNLIEMSNKYQRDEIADIVNKYSALLAGIKEEKM